MSRKTKVVTVTTEGRDHGKKFLLTEMPATQAEKWAFRAFLALGKAGIEIPDEVRQAGMLGMTWVGLRALSRTDYRDAEPLMDEMMTCVQAIRDPSRPALVFPLIETDTEEILTITFLRDQVFELHTGFSVGALISRLAAQAQVPVQEPTSQNIQTSREESGL